MEKIVKVSLMQKRNFEAESRFLHAKSNDKRFKVGKQFNDRLLYVDEQLSRIETWLLMLTDDEAQVVTRHLIDGIDLPRVAAKYKERWGEDYSKIERTIKSYQRKALQKITRFENENQEWMEAK